MKQTYTVFKKQWADYLDYLEVSVVLPEVIWGNLYISDELSRSVFIDKEFVGYHISLNNNIGFHKNYNFWRFDFVVLGFGVSFNRVWSC